MNIHGAFAIISYLMINHFFIRLNYTKTFLLFNVGMFTLSLLSL